MGFDEHLIGFFFNNQLILNIDRNGFFLPFKFNQRVNSFVLVVNG